MAHARGFERVVPSVPGRAVDLGSGGGLPGLVLATDWPSTEWVLLDAHERRTAFLGEAVASLALTNVRVVRARAETFGRTAGERGAYDLVTARGFGPPAVTAECAAPLLRVEGLLVVSEPPEEDPERWPDEGVALVGLRRDGEAVDAARYQVLRQIAPCPERFPRRIGVPAKRPLF